ncbi:MAG: hypothetical protein ACP5O4_03585 [bacterium]
MNKNPNNNIKITEGIFTAFDNKSKIYAIIRSNGIKIKINSTDKTINLLINLFK